MHRYEKITDFDREIWREELEGFVPSRIFDATLVCCEQLRAMKQAADMAELTPTETEAVFYRNAATLFGF